MEPRDLVLPKPGAFMRRLIRDIDRIMATFTNGVLEVTIPLPEAAVTVPTHKIPILDKTETKKVAKTAA